MPKQNWTARTAVMASAAAATTATHKTQERSATSVAVAQPTYTRTGGGGSSSSNTVPLRDDVRMRVLSTLYDMFEGSYTHEEMARAASKSNGNEERAIAMMLDSRRV